ncbi:retinol dehydrogenase 11-like [Cylas formicarius]|uniref:retinol dehydrogenase 11-like n=1 Tax=Cylas formicarius TaxID=197179 RepID=UPI0029584844|nr:retinol dehydrogenase 11-like [Cylas formicarius]
MGFLSTVLFSALFALIAFKIYLKLVMAWCRSQVCLVGKTVVVTGANTGVGYEAAIDFAKRGAEVILACRNEDKAAEARDRIRRETDNPNVSYVLVDFASLASVRRCADEIKKKLKRLDVLVNNAGSGNQRGFTEDGLDKQMQTNYFGPFLLTNLLLDLITNTPKSRIVNVSSTGAKYAKPIELESLNDDPGPIMMYARTKLCNVLFTIELARRLRGTTTTTYSLHPGSVATEIFRDLSPHLSLLYNYAFKWFFKTATEGAQTTIYCAVQKGIEQYTGEHFEDCKYVTRYESARTDDPELPRKLWENSELLVKLK